MMFATAALIKYLDGPLWVIIVLGTVGMLLVLRGYCPRLFKTAFWTTDRIAIAWLPIGAAGLAGAICAASFYVPPLSVAIRIPTVPTPTEMVSPSMSAVRHNETHNSHAIATDQSAKVKSLQLLDLFLSDFNTILRMHSDFPVVLNGIETHLTVQAYFDYNSKSDFVGFFIPSRVPDTYAMCVYLSGLDHAGSLRNSGVKTSGGIVGQMTNQEDLVFTGRIYIYHEGDLSIEQRASLIQTYRARHLDVQFRGVDYLIMQDH